ncbi:MAG: hypothetical protein FJ215_12965 [Ignavibacteria bacterium]|nr:hypothetical protein [Ignavibacteria bacterium]
MSAVPKLHTNIEFFPLDTASTSQTYVARAGEERRIEVSETLYRFIRLVDGNRSLEEIAAAFSEQTGKQCSAADAERIVETYLIPYGIIATENGKRVEAKQRSYLYVRIPLFSQPFLRPITGVLQVLFVPPVFYLGLFLIAALHLFLYAFVDRPAFSPQTITSTDVLLVAVLLFISTLFHELGHSSACHRFGAKHGDIGVGLYLYFPVFYADVTDVWRLKRTERAVVDSAGIYFQLLLVPFFYTAYLLTGHPALLYTIYALNLSIVGSLNPLLRFDGYWLASDLTGIPNLRKRAQETLRSLIKKLFKPRSTASLPALQLRPGARYFLYSYSLVSNLFFAFFLYHIVIHLPGLIGMYPAILIKFVTSLPGDIAALNFGAILKRLSSLLFPTIVFIMLALMLYRLLSGPLRTLSRLLPRKTAEVPPSK